MRKFTLPEMTDLHMHTTYSDGTDTPAELLQKVKEAGVGFFSVTDHDTCGGSAEMQGLLKEGDPYFVTGVEFSCRDKKGKYHILGYHYDTHADSIQQMVRVFHTIRMQKFYGRIRFLKDAYGFTFTEEEIDTLEHLKNPGKPHIGNLMVKHGYARNRTEAIEQYISHYPEKERWISPEEAMTAILDAGGIPVLAHGLFGDGGQHLDAAEMEERVTRLRRGGLMGLECFYSRYTLEQQDLMLHLRDKYHLLATAGSDYHGRNKSIRIGQVSHRKPEEIRPYLIDFFRAVC